MDEGILGCVKGFFKVDVLFIGLLMIWLKMWNVGLLKYGSLEFGEIIEIVEGRIGILRR